MLTRLGRAGALVIAISSHRANASPEIERNQVRAHKSWSKVFSEIIYFGPLEPSLSCPKTTFIECENFPFISSLCMAASMAPSHACLLNADIVVSDRLPMALNAVLIKKGQAAISRRWEFQGESIAQATLTDWGIDFFWATPELWRGAAKAIPAHYRIGHTSYDNWLMSYWNTVAPRWCYDITSRRVIFHPKHGDRNRPHHIKAIDDQFTINCGWPILKL